MKNNLIYLFKLIEITRTQPQYGWALRGLAPNDQSNLAEHHYLVTFIAWQLASLVKTAGAQIDVLKVIEFALIHDLGELFGSDIALPYAKANPKARQAAKQFEFENSLFLSQFFPDTEEYQLMAEEILDATSDEAIIAKIADFMELAHFKDHKQMVAEHDDLLLQQEIEHKVDNLKDPIAKKLLSQFIQEWDANYKKMSVLEIINQHSK